MRRLLLIGGGHAHAVAVREFLQRPLPECSVTLVSPSTRQTYSGMVPGLVSAHYTRAQCEIDVAGLARKANADFVQGEAVGFDPAAQRVALADGQSRDYDLLSINVGSLPNFAVAPGAQRWAIPAKPLDRFLDGWARIRVAAEQRATRIAVVGAGAAGIELALAMSHALASQECEARLVLFSDQPMFAANAARRLARALAREAVELREFTPVSAIEEGPILVAAGRRERFDFVVWTAGAAPPRWFRSSALALDALGFISVNHYLQSVSHAQVFAAGDNATLAALPHPKSGVYAIRHGAVLARNLRHAAAGEPLEAYAPQKRALALISTGRRHAIATYGEWSAEGDWLWRVKDWIDRRWMEGFAL